MVRLSDPKGRGEYVSKSKLGGVRLDRSDQCANSPMAFRCGPGGPRVMQCLGKVARKMPFFPFLPSVSTLSVQLTFSQ